MNKLLIGATLSALFAIPAVAADIPVKAPPATVAAAVYNWTGIYSVSSLGGASVDIDGAYVAPPDRHNTHSNRGVYGSHLGFQYQWNRLVLGVEGTYNTFLSNDHASSLSATGDCLISVPDRTCLSRVRNLWTVGGRLGVAFGNWMIFGTGGYAQGKIQTRTVVTSTPAVQTSETSDTHGGWFAGAGVEVFVGRIWWSDVILGAEYQHIDLRSATHRAFNPVNAINDRNMSSEIDIVRARLVFKWTPGGPVVARY